METTDPKVNRDRAALRSDVRRVRDDVVGIVHSAQSRGKGMIMESGGRVRGMIADLGGKAKEQFRDKSEALRDRGHKVVENWRGGVEHRPVSSLIIAFAAGALFAMFVARRRS